MASLTPPRPPFPLSPTHTPRSTAILPPPLPPSPSPRTPTATVSSSEVRKALDLSDFERLQGKVFSKPSSSSSSSGSPTCSSTVSWLGCLQRARDPGPFRSRAPRSAVFLSSSLCSSVRLVAKRGSFSTPHLLDLPPKSHLFFLLWLSISPSFLPVLDFGFGTRQIFVTTVLVSEKKIPKKRVSRWLQL